MAAPSPAVSNNSPGVTTSTTPGGTNTISISSPAAAAAAATGVGSPPTINSSKSQRGLNKPRCIKCQNVARSRCPYQSCKSCCAKANNPCHIHVLKGGSSFPDKVPSSSSPLFDQPSTEVSPSGNSARVTFRQLSQSFAQFNNLPSPLRSKKPLTRKDAALINECRFLKLKEYRDNSIESENEAFDRYMQNVNLLEEVFSVNLTQEETIEDGGPVAKPNSTSEDDITNTMVAELKASFRSNPARTDNIRKRMQYIVDKGLRNLSKFESDVGNSDYSEQDEPVTGPKKLKSRWAERASTLSDLIDKLNKARNEEDLKVCLQMKAQFLNKQTKKNEGIVENYSSSVQQSDYSPQKWFRTTTIDRELLACVDAQFSSLEDIEDL